MKKQSLLIVIVILILLGVSVGYSVVRISTNVKGKTSIVKDLDVNYKSLPAVFLNIFRLLPKNYQFCGYRQNLCRKFSAPPEDPLPPQ